jgi:hypothetical protein
VADHLDAGDRPMTDASVSLDEAIRRGSALLPLILAVGLAPFLLLHGWAELRSGFLTAFKPWYFLPGLALTVVAHEGLHAAGFLLFGRVPRSTVHFGVDRATLSPFAGCRQPMRVRAYRAAVLLPAVVLGGGTLIPAWVQGIGWLAIFGTLQLLAAGGDLVAYHAIRRLPGDTRVLDHPERVGCQVIG